MVRVFNHILRILKECTEDDVGEFFSECKAQTQTRTLMYFWRPPAGILSFIFCSFDMRLSVCLNGSLPAPVPNIPCSLVCDEGGYLDLNTITCQVISNVTTS